MSETRKLAAILFADVVGYSRLMGEDEAGTARAVRERYEAARPIFLSHGGRIVRTIGDGVFVEFPSVVAAVECAIAVQKLMVERNAQTPEPKRIVYRIGVNLGDVLIEGDDIVGDGVNIAARLESICEPGGVLVSGAAYEHVRGKVDAHFVDLGEKTLKNIARPTRVYAIEPFAKTAAPAAMAASPEQRGPPRLSIVVLPFANLSGDPAQDYFVDGVTESLTTDLSRIPLVVVIGRNTAFTYKGKPVDLRQTGRELNVRYVLEGSVQRAGARIRVGVQLIDAESGSHIWADRFDKPMADLFDMQDEIVARIANALNIQLVAAEARRAERATNPDSIDLSFQGRALLAKAPSRENLAEARRLFERALALDQASIGGLIGVALVEMVTAITYYSEDQPAQFAAAEAALVRALTLAPENATIHLCLGIVYNYTFRAAEGIRECERALELNRNLAMAHAQIGLAKLALGEPEATEAHIREALRLSPHDNYAYVWHTTAGLAELYCGRDAEAVARLRRALQNRRGDPTPHFILAVALAGMGLLAEARTEAKAGLAINPTYTIARIRAGALSVEPAFAAFRERLIDGLRKAGVPEG